MIPIIILPDWIWKLGHKQAGAVLKYSLIAFTVSWAIATLFGWLVSLTTFPNIFNSAAGILIMAAISAALVSLIPLSLALPIWISGLRGVRMLMTIAAFTLAGVGVILALQSGFKWLPHLP